MLKVLRHPKILEFRWNKIIKRILMRANVTHYMLDSALVLDTSSPYFYDRCCYYTHVTDDEDESVGNSVT